MSLVTYNLDIPLATNNPSVDQPNMKTNTNAVNTILGIDHYAFNDSNGGLHKQVRMPVSGSVPSTSSGDGCVYTKSSTGSQLYYTPDNSTNEYQMTRCIAASFTTFSTNTNYSGTIYGGWTFLPGGLLMQYGKATSSGTSLPNTTITFPVTFTSGVYSINCTILTTDDSRYFVEVYDSSVSQFRAVTRDSGGSKTSGIQFYWQVIGK